MKIIKITKCFRDCWYSYRQKCGMIVCNRLTTGWKRLDERDTTIPEWCPLEEAALQEQNNTAMALLARFVDWYDKRNIFHGTPFAELIEQARSIAQSLPPANQALKSDQGAVGFRRFGPGCSGKMLIG